MVSVSRFVNTAGGEDAMRFRRVYWNARMLGMIRVVKVKQVVDADYFDRVRDAVVVEKPPTDGSCDGKRVIKLLDDVLHGSSDVRPGGCALNGFFVADRPGNNAGMIAVAPNHGAELLEVFRRAPKIAVLVDDQHAKPIAGIEQCRSRRVMGTAVGV